MAQANAAAAAKSSNNLTMDKKILGEDNYWRAYTSNVSDMSMPIELGISDQTVPTMNLILSTIRMKNPKLRPQSNPNAVNSNNTATAVIAAVRGSKFEAAAIASLLNETIQLQIKLSLQKGWIRKLGIEKKVVNFFMNKASKKKQMEMQTEQRGENEAARPSSSLNKTFNKDKTTKTTTARRRLDTTFSVIKSSPSQGQPGKGVLTKKELNKTFSVASNRSNISSTAQLCNTKNQTNKLPLRPSSVSVVSVTATSASMGYNIR